MRHIKILGLTVIAATAVLSFAGTGSASATVLCLWNEAPCEEPLPSGTTIKGETEEPGIFQKGEQKTKCNSSFTAKTTSSGGKEKAVTALITSVTYSSCTGTCSSAKTLNLPYKATIEETSGGEGEMTVEKGPGGGEPEVELSCQLPPPVVVACIYGIPLETWSLEPGHPGHSVKTHTRFLQPGSAMTCAPEMTETWRYRITNPPWIYVQPL